MVRNVEIANGIYWVGTYEEASGLQCNPYLIVDGDEALLIDPGSVLDFEQVFNNITSIIPLEKLKYIVLSHQDPDLASSVTLFEQKGAKFKIATHWRTSTLVRYYGIKSEYYTVNENDYKLTLKSGRVIHFQHTPYLHFSGAIVTYDPISKILFSSDLFGAFSYRWELFADDDYIETMKVFHEHYMPANDILRPVMEMFLTLDIAMIAPQHGSIIKHNVKEHIKALRELECGAFLNPIRREISKIGGFSGICNQVIKRYCSIFESKEIMHVFEGTEIQLNSDTFEIKDFNCTGEELWNKIFDIIYSKKGIVWITVMEPLVQKLAAEYDIEIPSIFSSLIIRSEDKVSKLSSENKHLKEINERLSNSIIEAEEKLIKCPVTGLYNEQFFKNYLKVDIESLIGHQQNMNFGLLFIDIDNISRINFNYGRIAGDEILANFTYILNDIKDDNHLIFKLNGAAFAYYIPYTTKQEALKIAEQIRNTIEKSEIFIEKMTVSVGVVVFDEISDTSRGTEEIVASLFNIAMLRVKIAKNRGMNIVCGESSTDEYVEEIGCVLIADTDRLNVDVLKISLENQKIKVLVASDGETALEIIEKESPDLVITEIMLPKNDGFLVRQRSAMQSRTKNIPFIFMSYQKDEETVARALELNVDYYFKKPFMLSEIIGIIKNKLKESSMNVDKL